MHLPLSSFLQEESSYPDSVEIEEIELFCLEGLKAVHDTSSNVVRLEGIFLGSLG
jgi:hypothetical protein